MCISFLPRPDNIAEMQCSGGAVPDFNEHLPHEDHSHHSVDLIQHSEVSGCAVLDPWLMPFDFYLMLVYVKLLNGMRPADIHCH